MSRHNRLPVDILKTRVDHLKNDLSVITEEIEIIKTERDEDLLKFEADISNAKNESAWAKEDQLLLIKQAEDTRQQGEQLIAKGKQLLSEAKKSKETAEKMDLKYYKIQQATQALKDRQTYWAEKLSQLQTGTIRRKQVQLRRDIEKLEQRIERKEKEKPTVTGVVSVIPTGTGTQLQQESEAPQRSV